MSVLSVKNLGKVYRSYRSEWLRVGRWFGIEPTPAEETWVLRNINFEIEPGESIGIVGQNGAGKSTLLKIIAGTLQLTEGEVKVNGRVAAILELGMSFDPELTGRQNVRHAAGLMGFTPNQIAAAMPDIEVFADISEYFDEPVRTYSSGMNMRIAFAVATAQRPEILIVDEALSVGDPYFQAKCFKRINDFKRQGTTFVLVSHNIEDLVKHCERAIMLKDGHIEMDGSPREVGNRYLDDLFGNSPNSLGGEMPAEIEVVNSMLSGLDDEFHTRPGYLASEHRWGHGGAQILDYLVIANEQKYPSHIDTNSTASFYFKVRFDADFVNVVPGFLIKTLEGIYVYGTNSFLSSRGRTSISAKTGDIRIFCFSAPLTLNAGNYMVSLGVSSGDPQVELLPLDRRYDSIMVQLGSAAPIVGIADLNATFRTADSFAEGAEL